MQRAALTEVGVVRIDGSTPALARSQAVELFQAEPAVRVALVAISAGGTALTLTAASTVVFLELFWTPGALLQEYNVCNASDACNVCDVGAVLQGLPL